MYNAAYQPRHQILQCQAMTAAPCRTSGGHCCPHYLHAPRPHHRPGNLINKLPELWAGATLEERIHLISSMLDAVYVDTKKDKCIVGIRPKPPFMPVFKVATTREGSGVVLLNEPPDDNPEARSCCWWRRGRVELPRKHGLTIRLVFNTAMNGVCLLPDSLPLVSRAKALALIP